MTIVLQRKVYTPHARYYIHVKNLVGNGIRALLCFQQLQMFHAAVQKLIRWCEISGSHGGQYEDESLLEDSTV
jgi:hypothetical protein